MPHDLARSVVRRAQREAKRQGALHQLWTVLTTDGGVQIMSLDNAQQVLQDDQFEMTHGLQTYHKDTGLDKGDNLVGHRMSGRWVMVDVLSDSPAVTEVGVLGSGVPAGEHMAVSEGMYGIIDGTLSVKGKLTVGGKMINPT